MSGHGIEWLNQPGYIGESWNVTHGCSPVSAGCQNCWARRMARRLGGRFDYPKDEPFRPVASVEKLRQPFDWKGPRSVAVSLMGDLFHDGISFPFIAAVFGVMAATPRHTYHVLTKRPERAVEWFGWISTHEWPDEKDGFIEPVNECFEHAADFISDEPEFRYEQWWPDDDEYPPWPLPNVRVGVSVEDQAMANERIPLLLRIPAACRYVSIEPMLEDIDLRCLPANVRPRSDLVHSFDHFNALTGEGYDSQRCSWHYNGMYPSLDWVIAGCESGPGRRVPAKGERGCFHHLLGQVAPAKVPFFLKQMSFDGEVFKTPRLWGRQWLQLPR